MRRLLTALALAGLAVTAFHGSSFADDPPAPGGGAPAAPDVDAARVHQLVDNLGSDDFHIREQATKDLAALGEKVRAALEAAKKSDSAEVRYRADQLLRRLDGGRGDRRLDDGAGNGAGAGAGGAAGREARRRMRQAWSGVGPGSGGFDMDEWAKHLREELDRLQREADKFGNGSGFGFGFPGLEPLWGAFGGSAPRTLRSEAGTLVVSPRGARLVVVDHAPDGSNVTATYEGKSLDAILSAHEDLRGRAGMAALVEQAKKAEDDAKKAQEEAKNAPAGRGGFSFRSDVDQNQMSVEVGPNGAKVTITQTGPDGKPVTKTYEGADLDTIKREHPELASRLGSFSVHLGPVPPGARSMPGEDDDGEDDDDAPGGMAPNGPGATEPRSGPFGLGLATSSGGAKVVVVRPGSDAAAAGLRVGDLITAVNGQSIEPQTPIADLVRKGHDAGSVTFDVLRDGVTTKLSWTKK